MDKIGRVVRVVRLVRVGREGTEVTVMRTEGVTVPMKNMKGGKEIREKERRGRR